MQPFKTFTGIVAPLDRANVDTDVIIPKQYLKSIKRTGFGPNMFDDWRYLEPGNPGDDHTKRKINSEFVLNQPRYQNAEILLTRENFGCGSSREHAVWALMDYGFRTVVATSFADIFYSNCFKNGLLPIQLEAAVIEKLIRECMAIEDYQLKIDLENQVVESVSNETFNFKIKTGLKEKLLKGLDDISITLGYADEIKTYEMQRKKEAPWLFSDYASE